jgi:hypothetical protein
MDRRHSLDQELAARTIQFGGPAALRTSRGAAWYLSYPLAQKRKAPWSCCRQFFSKAWGWLSNNCRLPVLETTPLGL